MRLDDGREVIVTGTGLALPLPMTTVAALYKGIDAALTRIGYRDVAILTDGPHAGSITATPPPGGPHDPDEGWDDADDEAPPGPVT